MISEKFATVSVPRRTANKLADLSESVAVPMGRLLDEAITLALDANGAKSVRVSSVRCESGRSRCPHPWTWNGVTRCDCVYQARRKKR